MENIINRIKERAHEVLSQWTLPIADYDLRVGRIPGGPRYWISLQKLGVPSTEVIPGFEVNVDYPAKILYLLKIKLAEEDQHKGHGTRLYELLVELAANFGLDRVVQTHAGQIARGETRENYLRRRGWKGFDGIQLYKSTHKESTLKPEYQTWIDENITCHSLAYGRCREVCEAMQDAFPELKRVRGHYYCSAWGERGHWWLRTSEGEIVDPTALQFPSRGNGVYVAWVEGTEEPTGKCMECGRPTWQGTNSCSYECSLGIQSEYGQACEYALAPQERELLAEPPREPLSKQWLRDRGFKQETTGRVDKFELDGLTIIFNKDAMQPSCDIRGVGVAQHVTTTHDVLTLARYLGLVMKGNGNGQQEPPRSNASSPDLGLDGNSQELVDRFFEGL